MPDIKPPVYIGIPDHLDIRRDLLLCSKDIITSLKAYESAREDRLKRIELTFELHKIMDELGVLTKKTRLKLPRMPGRISISQETSPKSEQTGSPIKKAKKIESDKLGILDQEMTRIEAKLKRLA